MIEVSQKNFFISLLISSILFFSLIVFSQSVFAAVILNNPITDGQNAVAPDKLYGRIVQTILGLVGVFALIFFIWGGFLWMNAGGNDEQVKKGRDTLLWATLGLVAIFSSYAILRVIIQTLSSSTIG